MGAIDIVEQFHNGSNMVSLTLKDIPDALHQRLREQATAHGRSLNKEIIASLEQVIAPRRVHIPAYLSRIEQLHRQIDFKVTLDDIQQAVETGRP